MSSKDIFELYISGMSIGEINGVTGISRSTLRGRLKKAGILRSVKEGIINAAARGRMSRPPRENYIMSEETKKKISESHLKSSPFRSDGVRITPNGYAEFTTGKNKGRSVHILVMENRIGRKLYPDECVHHIDEDKLNNDENNLCLLTRSAHMRLHRLQDELSGNFRERKSNGRFA